MNDTTNVLAGDDLPAEVVALRTARQHAAEARQSAERALREAQEAELQLARREDQALAAAIATKGRQLSQCIEVAALVEHAAPGAVAVLQTKIQTEVSTRLAAEAVIAELRAALLREEERQRAAEAAEAQLQHELRSVHVAVQECVRARLGAEEALRAMSPPVVPSIKEELQSIPLTAAERAAERRAADATRRAADAARAAVR